MPAHPDFIRHMSDLPEEQLRIRSTGEPLSFQSDLSQALGLKQLQIRHETIPPGHRSSSPHSHTTREECFYVLEGTPEVWIDGEFHPLKSGDSVGFPAGEGRAHMLVNRSEQPARLLAMTAEPGAADEVNYVPCDWESLSGKRAGQDSVYRGQGADFGQVD